MPSDWWFYRDESPDNQATYYIPLARLQTRSQETLAEFLGFDLEGVQNFYTSRTPDDKVMVEVHMKGGTVFQYTGYYTDATLVLE